MPVTRFCRGGVITDIYCAAMCVGWEAIPIEDLIKPVALDTVFDAAVMLDLARKQEKTGAP